LDQASLVAAGAVQRLQMLTGGKRRIHLNSTIPFYHGFSRTR
jgi:hypothetical protein